MSLFTEPLADSIEVCGKRYPVHTGFKTWIKFEKLAQNFEKNPVQTAAEMIKLCLNCRRLPSSLCDTLSGLCDFYSGKNKAEVKGEKSFKRIYDFEYDADLIYAAFVRLYGIDLCKSNMHWHKFTALFSSITKNTKFGEILAIRATDVNEITDKKLKADILRLKRQCSLPDTTSEEEKENRLAEMISKI